MAHHACTPNCASAAVIVGHNQVGRLMRNAGLVGLPLKRRFKNASRAVTAEDLVNREFTRAEPDRLWVTDITEHRTREGKLYCCVVLDAYSRRVVGWSIDAAPTALLATNALTMAIENRRPTRQRRHPSSWPAHQHLHHQGVATTG